MGIIRLLFGYKDPAKRWPVSVDQSLHFNFDRSELNNVGLNIPWSSLAVFGPPEMKRRNEDDSLVYLSRGFSADLFEAAVTSYSFVWRDYLKQGFQPFQGTFTYRRQNIELDAETTEQDLESIFGEPYCRDEGKDEIILFYEVENAEWQFELDLTGKLKTFLVLANPVLADEFQRECYKVKKPWPPKR
jgi:hypothetical protein